LSILLICEKNWGILENKAWNELHVFHSSGHQLLWHSNSIAAMGAQNCTPAAVLDFPPDLFTLEQRQAGAVVVHAVICCYLFVMLALICDDYFVPCIQKMCGRKCTTFFQGRLA
jgi:hypothetical protein